MPNSKWIIWVIDHIYPTYHSCRVKVIARACGSDGGDATFPGFLLASIILQLVGKDVRMLLAVPNAFPDCFESVGSGGDVPLFKRPRTAARSRLTSLTLRCGCRLSDEAVSTVLGCWRVLPVLQQLCKEKYRPSSPSGEDFRKSYHFPCPEISSTANWFSTH